MRDSAAEYIAVWHAHLPVAKFLLGRQGHKASVTGEQPMLADVIAVATRRAAGASPPSSA